jgi:hypothetical protein
MWGFIFPHLTLNIYKEVKRLTENGNGNGRKRLFDPVLIFIRLIQGFWERRDLVSGETTIVDDQTVEEDLQDRLELPESDNQDN